MCQKSKAGKNTDSLKEKNVDYGNQGRMNVLHEFDKNTLEPILKEI